MKDLIVFDLDGTIEDSRLDMALSVNRIRKLYQLPEIPIEALQSLVNKGMNFLYKNCFPELVKEQIPEDLKKKYEIHYAEHIIDNTKLYSEMDTILEKLSKKYYLFVYTNKPENLSKLLLKKLGVLSYFQSVIGGDSFSFTKPNPEPILKMIQTLHLDVKNIYVVGDSEIDIQTALELKANSVWCKWGYYQNISQEFFPDFIAKQPKDLLRIFDIE